MHGYDSLSLYKFIFVAELIIAEALTCTQLKRRKHFVPLLVLSILATLLFAFLLPPLDGAIASAFLFLAIFVFTVLMMKVCFQEPWRKLIFCGIAGYTTQHVASQFFELSVLIMGLTPTQDFNYGAGSNPMAYIPLFNFGSGQMPIAGNPFVLVYYAFLFGLIYFIIYKFVSPRLKNSQNIELKNVSLLVVVAIVVIFDVFLSATVTDYSQQLFDRRYLELLNITNIACCLLALYLQFSVALVHRLEDDLSKLTLLREREREQFDLMKENINLINIKCHDLKHQIREMGEQSSVDSQTIHELQDLISIYDCNVKTQNEALDVILTEKSLRCNSNGITLSCIADGSKLSFMSDEDIYSLFGNLVDNAMEAVGDVPPDKRTVSLFVRESHAFIVVQIYNYYSGEIKFKDGLPVTSKGDTFNHGFGMKSIKMTVEKYGGKLYITTEDGVFNIKILFPVNQEVKG